MTKQIPLLVFFVVISLCTNAQSSDTLTCCIAPEIRTNIMQKIAVNIENNRIKKRSDEPVLYDWPLRQAAGFDYPDYYYISSFVDRDPTDRIADFNCGQRSYNGHNGTDIALSPFPWRMMEQNQVEVVAAAEGVIIDKSDGRFDQYCVWVWSSQANYLILLHDDGNHTLYWHLKKGSVTTKAIGERVQRGEYLGVVGSSGLSSAPHLHFEVTDAQMNAIDPFKSSCNELAGKNLWNKSPPYKDPSINHIQTSDQLIEFGNCPNPENPNTVDIFEGGDMIYYYAFYRDLLKDQPLTFSIKQPDGVNWKTWVHKENNDYNDYWYYKSFELPADAMIGTWTFKATYGYDTVKHRFTVKGADTNTTIVNTGTDSTTTNTPTGNCTTPFNGFTLIGEFMGNNYYISTGKATWKEAQYFLSNSQLSFVSIKNSAENEFIRSKLDNEMAFIGYTDMVTEGNFEWSNGTSSFSNLEGDNSDAGDFAVINYWNGGWSLDGELVERPFIVELVCNEGEEEETEEETEEEEEEEENDENEATDCIDNIAEAIFLGTFEGHNYFLSNDKKTWKEAQDNALLHNGYLASITSDGENKFLTDAISEIVFIGYNDANGDGVYGWASGEPATFLHISGSNSGKFASINFWDGSWSFDGNNIFTERKYLIEIPCITAE